MVSDRLCCVPARPLLHTLGSLWVLRHLKGFCHLDYACPHLWERPGAVSTQGQTARALLPQNSESSLPPSEQPGVTLSFSADRDTEAQVCEVRLQEHDSVCITVPNTLTKNGRGREMGSFNSSQRGGHAGKRRKQLVTPRARSTAERTEGIQTPSLSLCSSTVQEQSTVPPTVGGSSHTS